MNITSQLVEKLHQEISGQLKGQVTVGIGVNNEVFIGVEKKSMRPLVENILFQPQWKGLKSNIQITGKIKPC